MIYSADDQLVRELVELANRLHVAAHQRMWPGNSPSLFTAHDAKKYIYLDCRESGVHLIERDTGDIYGIKAYGKIHRGKRYGNLEDLVPLLHELADGLDQQGACLAYHLCGGLPSVAVNVTATLANRHRVGEHVRQLVFDRAKGDYDCTVGFYC